MIQRHLTVIAGLATLAFAPLARARSETQFVVEEVLEVGRVVADFQIGFSLLTTSGHQFAAYYDDQRRMTVAMRELGDRIWQYQTLPSKVGWDSHNDVTLAVDRAGHVHVSGNLHADPLVYFRSESPWDIKSLKAARMIGDQERRTTYPKFLEDREGRLLFNYRSGGSGDGVHIWNRYDTETQTWSRLLETPLLDGEGECSAYPSLPRLGPDGFFHMLWVWRDTPDCATNHHLSYARSEDLLHWKSAFGEPLSLPLTLDQKSAWVDPIPPRGGIINGGFRMAFDTQKRPFVVYHKSDEQGHMQIYAAHPVGGRWEKQVLTQWSEPVEFSGTGSRGFVGIRLGALEAVEPGIFKIGYRHRDYGSGGLFFKDTDLQPCAYDGELLPEYPAALGGTASDFPGMKVRRAFDRAGSIDGDRHFFLQWESVGPHADNQPDDPRPDPSTLRLYEMRRVKP